MWAAYFSDIVSPVLISAAAAFTLAGVMRLRRPSYSSLSESSRKKTDEVTWSSSPQTHAVPGGASARLGTSLRLGNLVQLGSNGIVVAVLLNVKMSLACASDIVCYCGRVQMVTTLLQQSIGSSKVRDPRRFKEADLHAEHHYVCGVLENWK